MPRSRRQHLALQLMHGTGIPRVNPTADADSDRDDTSSSARPAASRKRGREGSEDPESRPNP
jgi:hypothetical protein